MNLWLFSTLGALLAAAGLAVALLALFRDRSRGCARCPRCWYSLAGLERGDAPCPECGHAPSTPAALYRTRRHWLRAAAGLALIAAGVATHAAPIVHRDGWHSLAPNSLLVFLIPPYEQQWPISKTKGGYHPAIIELSRRLERGGLRDWQWRTLIRRGGIIRCRDTWPADQPLMVAMERPHWAPFCAISVRQPSASACEPDRTLGDLAPVFCRTGAMGAPRSGYAMSLGPLPEGASAPELAVTVQWVPLAHGSPKLAAMNANQLPPVRTWNGRLALPTRIVPATADAIGASQDEAAAEALRLSIKMLVHSYTTPKAGSPRGTTAPTR